MSEFTSNNYLDLSTGLWTDQEHPLRSHQTQEDRDARISSVQTLILHVIYSLQKKPPSSNSFVSKKHRERARPSGQRPWLTLQSNAPPTGNRMWTPRSNRGGTRTRLFDYPRMVLQGHLTSLAFSCQWWFKLDGITQDFRQQLRIESDLNLK